LARTADARHIAWRVLRAVDDGAFADAALARHLTGTDLAERDRGLATQLVYGTLAWQGLADHALDTWVQPAGSLEPEIRVLLRMALYQMTKLDRVPDFAIVDTSVELAKQHRAGRAAGLVNAVLRRFVRSGKHLPLPDESDLASHLAVALSHPRWLVVRWLDQLGPDQTRRLLEANNCAAPTVLRANLRRISRDGAIAALERDGCSARPTSYSPAGIECALRGRLTDLAAFRDGLVTAQGEASQLVASLVPAAATNILDACAAPGGKTTHLAERAPDDARIAALDRSRVGLISVARQAARLGVSAHCVRADARSMPLRADARFDAVLVDAPCSGFGTLRQHPEIRWRRQPADIVRLAAAQAAILEEAASRVRPQGCLVYATCTILDEENDARVADFLAGHPEFSVDDPRGELPDTARALIGTDGILRTFPHQHGLDGFFAARLKRLR
jgi:16S rRNA (cytosine967-C5)-methyltransferase